MMKVLTNQQSKLDEALTQFRIDFERVYFFKKIFLFFLSLRMFSSTFFPFIQLTYAICKEKRSSRTFCYTRKLCVMQTVKQLLEIINTVNVLLPSKDIEVWIKYEQEKKKMKNSTLDIYYNHSYKYII